MFRYDSSTIYYDQGRKIYITEYIKTKETPKGFWVKPLHSSFSQPKHFVLNKARKKFCHETKREAAEAFLARRERQIEILKYQLKNAKHDKDLILQELKKL